ncbi:MAG TPA: glutathione binding-like protein [Sphingomicrobium sp.]|jgi:glutathione S-transferase|nr:glutathione binding-like protein [Sphingomicrobium sp.]
MMKLFYSPGACSLVPHVALEEAGAEFEAVRVMLAEGEHLQPGYLAINPHARVPSLATERGTITENIAILNFIADQFGAAGSVPLGDAYVTARANELLGWFASTVHISFAQVWRASRFTRDESVHHAIIDGGRENLAQQFAEIEALAGDGWLAGDRFTAVDSYALTFFRWGNRIDLDMSRYPNWAALNARLLAEPSVRRVIDKEGLGTELFQPAA